ncbi:MAG: ATP-binding protein [Saprospiraceae bacterium]
MEKILPRLATQTLQKLLDWFPAVAIVGPRQVGKTTLAKNISAALSRPTVYLDLEAEKDRRKLKDPYLFLKRYEGHCVVLDEIQRMPGLFELLRVMVDEHREPGRFLLLGSASPALLQQSSETLAGRIAYFELAPFNFLEINALYKEEDLWLRGGFPGSLLAEGDELSFIWRQNFIRTYLERDLRLLGLTTEPAAIRRFWQMTASANGSIWNGERFASSLGVSGGTVKKQLDFLENAFLLTVLQAWHSKMGKRMVKAPKVYVRDSGILHTLLRLDFYEELLAHPALGSSWEGFVIEQIRQLVGDNLACFYYRTHNGSECDLVLAKGSEALAAIEIKFSSAPDVSKGFYLALEDLGTAHNFVVVPHGGDYPLKPNVEVVSLISFLQNHLPKLLGK